jgi:uncharacterized membrane protein
MVSPLDSRIIQEIKSHPGCNVSDIAMKNTDYSSSHTYNRVKSMSSRKIIRVEKTGRSTRLYLIGD